LKREATAAKVLVDPERAAADARRAARQRKTAATEARRERIGELRKLFIDLNQLKPSSTAERQARGYRLERLLADLFRAYDIDYGPSYRVEGEQIDGSFHFRGFTYLVEARWRPGSSGPRGAQRAPRDLRCHQWLSSDCSSSQTGMMPAAALTFPGLRPSVTSGARAGSAFLSGHSRDLQQHAQG
jgi:hypothetical protein